MKELLETGIYTDLGYSGRCDALVGRVKELSVVIKENNATKSYGCLIWVRKKDSVSDDELYAYLSEQVAAKPHIIKHFKTTGRGAALALVKYNDPSRNLNNINRFLGDLADDLYAHDYVNCCYACGKTEGLAVYANGGAVVQYCPDCAQGTRVEVGDLPEAPAAAEETPAETPAGETYGSDAEELFSAMANAAADISEADKAETMEDLLAPPVAESAELFVSDDAEVISTENDNVDFGEFVLTETETAPGEVFEEPVYEVSEPETAAEASATDELGELMLNEVETAPEEAFEEPAYAASETEEAAKPDSALESLMFSGEDAAGETAQETNARTSGEPAFGDANTYIDGETEEGSTDLGSLMSELDALSSEDPGDEPTEKDEAEADAENANIYGLMIGSEQELAEAGDAEVTVLSTADTGAGSDIKVTVQEEEDFGIDTDIQVTEIVDDSNEGEDIQIEALSSDFNMPTDTKGGEIKASDTPLEKDGTVPMVNPSSDFADVKPSPVRDKNAVRAFAYGSYENANTAAEPVRFDGRPVGYQGTDPRLGDEMGSVSRDYARQNAARTAPGAKPLKATGFRVVSKADPARNKPISQRGYPTGSNAVVGTIAALLIGAVGCALWCGIGYVLGLAGMPDGGARSVVMAVLGFIPTAAVFLGYRIGGDCCDMKGLIISAVVSVVMDVTGMIAVFVAGEMQAKAAELGYGIPFDKAFENVLQKFSGAAASGDAFLQLFVTLGVMVAALVAAVIITKKKI